MLISRSKYHHDLSGLLVDTLADGNPTFYGLSPDGARRALEQDTLYQFEPEHDYKRGWVVMRDGTRMATAQARAREAGWNDLAEMMASRGKP